MKALETLTLIIFLPFMFVGAYFTSVFSAMFDVICISYKEYLKNKEVDNSFKCNLKLFVFTSWVIILCPILPFFNLCGIIATGFTAKNKGQS